MKRKNEIQRKTDKKAITFPNPVEVQNVMFERTVYDYTKPYRKENCCQLCRKIHTNVCTIFITNSEYTTTIFNSFIVR